MRGHPSAPAIAGLVHFRERSAAQVSVNESGSEGIPCTDGVGNGCGDSGMAMEAFVCGEEAAFTAHGDGDELDGVFLQKAARGGEEAGFASIFGARYAKHGQDFRHFNFVQLEDGGGGQQGVDDIHAEEWRAQVYVEDADAIGAGRSKKLPDCGAGCGERIGGNGERCGWESICDG